MEAEKKPEGVPYKKTKENSNCFEWDKGKLYFAPGRWALEVGNIKAESKQELGRGNEPVKWWEA